LSANVAGSVDQRKREGGEREKEMMDGGERFDGKIL